MMLEITAKIEIDEDSPETMNHFIEMLSKLGDLEGANVGVESEEAPKEDESDETKSYEEILEELPSDEYRYAYRALVQESGHSRRVIHRKASQIDGSPFDNFDPENETPERREIGDILWDLEKRGYARHEGNKWFPEAELFTKSAAAADW